jgi:uncharacterized protein (DUF488 family)
MLPKRECQSITVWTIGYDNRSIEAILKLLNKHQIKIVVDVRRFPTSKIEHFKQESMKQWLCMYKIKYVWLGEELGGYRKGGYKKYMRTKIFKMGVQKLLNIAREKPTCIMCVEKNPKYCHRRFLSTYLEERGTKIIHIQ